MLPRQTPRVVTCEQLKRIDTGMKNPNSGHGPSSNGQHGAKSYVTFVASYVYSFLRTRRFSAKLSSIFSMYYMVEIS